jgi:hypothetical protein
VVCIFCIKLPEVPQNILTRLFLPCFSCRLSEATDDGHIETVRLETCQHTLQDLFFVFIVDLERSYLCAEIVEGMEYASFSQRSLHADVESALPRMMWSVYLYWVCQSAPDCMSRSSYRCKWLSSEIRDEIAKFNPSVRLMRGFLKRRNHWPPAFSA